MNAPTPAPLSDEDLKTAIAMLPVIKRIHVENTITALEAENAELKASVRVLVDALDTLLNQGNFDDGVYGPGGECHGSWAAVNFVESIKSSIPAAAKAEVERVKGLEESVEWWKREAQAALVERLSAERERDKLKGGG